MSYLRDVFFISKYFHLCAFEELTHLNVLCKNMNVMEQHKGIISPVAVIRAVSVGSSVACYTSWMCFVVVSLIT